MNGLNRKDVQISSTDRLEPVKVNGKQSCADVVPMSLGAEVVDVETIGKP